MRHVITATNNSGDAVFTAEYATREELNAAYAALAALFGEVGDAHHQYNVVSGYPSGKKDAVIFSATTYL